ncbi:hypothetical protein Ddye_015909 [Dipteronia dyeriana]|uniref:RNase H type-1 domain-containing protein n=1 Tax=Dipteronia dyeriana TaxID=168575 RepID=A0AAD9WZZ9_9ROSI|nr:hypothetical protein Ddye_015909 [Dipteronia dyeriana]
MANLSLALDSVKFKVGWWFKNFRSGRSEDIMIYLLDIEGRCIYRQPTKDISPCSWCPLLNNDLIFNVDGSARGNPGMDGIGGVLRDVRVSWINREGFGNLSHVNLVYDIRQILLWRNFISIKFTPSRFNSLADSLAKDGSGSNGDRLEWGVS